MSDKFIVLIKLCCKKSNNGSAINPENDIALPISIMSEIMLLLGVRKNWKTIRNNKDVNIINTIFKIKSLKVELKIL